MTLHPESAALLQQMSADGAPRLYELPVEQARHALKAATLDTQSEPREVSAVQNLTVPTPDGHSLPLRIYRSSRRSDTGGDEAAVVLLIHGGGWALGDLETHDAMCRWICEGGRQTVVSVDYRLAPEHPFPRGLHDCVTAAKWVRSATARKYLTSDDHQNITLTVLGDSAGGNLAAVLAQMSRVEGLGIQRQVLLYPCLDAGTDLQYPSRRIYGGGDYFLGMQDLHWLRGLYFNEPPAPRDARHSPIHARDLAGLPRALVITAGCDMLRDEARRYADLMLNAGNLVDYRDYPGAIHGFCSFQGVLTQGRHALDAVCAWLTERAPGNLPED